MMRRTARLLIRLMAALIGGLAVLAVALGWRLAQGPISLDLLVPYVGEWLSTRYTSDVVVDHTVLTIVPGPRLELFAQGVHLTRGATRIDVPALALDANVASLFAGRLVPARVTLYQPRLWLQRRADGSFHVGFGEGGESALEWGENASPHGLGDLIEVAVEGASVIVDDRWLGVVWRARSVFIDLHHSERPGEGEHWTGGASVTVEVEGQDTDLHGTLDYWPMAGSVEAALGWKGLRPSALADAAPALAPLAILQMPLSGALRAKFDLA
ncbi:MAG TPA: hypothetical protein VKT70_08410, partial [Stellaceae bacterium]|nr:hypothetical protein [Stellaceae bacterium]